jgi:hypothetical protein
MKLTIKLASAARAPAIVRIASVAPRATAPAAAAAPAAPAAATDPDNVQSGDQTTPDTPAAASATKAAADETAIAETGAPSDGPGGHTDSGPNVDHQFDGVE